MLADIVIPIKGSRFSSQICPRSLDELADIIHSKQYIATLLNFKIIHVSKKSTNNHNIKLFMHTTISHALLQCYLTCPTGRKPQLCCSGPSKWSKALLWLKSLLLMFIFSWRRSYSHLARLDSVDMTELLFWGVYEQYVSGCVLWTMLVACSWTPFLRRKNLI